MADIKMGSTEAILKRLLPSCTQKNTLQAALAVEETSRVDDEPSESPTAAPDMPRVLANCLPSKNKENDLSS